MRTGNWWHRQRLMLAAVGLVAAAMLSACSGEAAPADEVEVPSQNRAQWVMPADPYRISWEQWETVQYSDRLVIADCLTDAGYPSSVPFKDVAESWKVPTWTVTGLRYFDERIAATYGYSEGHTPLPNEAEWAAYFDEEYSDAKLAAQKKCLETRKDDLVGRKSTRIFNLASEFMWNAPEVANEAPAVKEAAVKWHECMKPLGLVDLPASPYPMMPTETQTVKFEKESVRPGPLQLREAMTDAACRDSSGYAEAAYQAEWAEQERILTENIDEFERIRVEADENYQQAVRTIAELGPSS